MSKCIMVGCDLHEKSMLLKVAEGLGRSETRVFQNDTAGRKAMVAYLRKRSAASGAKIVFAYEASCQGFGLSDEVRDVGFECYVLAPTRIARSAKHRRSKTDEKDAEKILEIVRGHILAGNELPAVWVPDMKTREDREVVRARLDLSDKGITLKAQIKMLLKRNGLRKPSGMGKKWTKGYRAWLKSLTGSERVSNGARVGLKTLLRQLEFMESEIEILQKEVENLSQTERYFEYVQAMCEEKGVGILTAMVFLTEMGDLNRFTNRRQVGAYLGLIPSSDESGESADRKGHITHQGPHRVRKALCQAVWSRVRTDEEERIVYQRIAKKNPKHKKIAVVASMRRLAIRLWHIGVRIKKKGVCLPENEVSAVA